MSPPSSKFLHLSVCLLQNRQFANHLFVKSHSSLGLWLITDEQTKHITNCKQLEGFTISSLPSIVLQGPLSLRQHNKNNVSWNLRTTDCVPASVPCPSCAHLSSFPRALQSRMVCSLLMGKSEFRDVK